MQIIFWIIIPLYKNFHPFLHEMFNWQHSSLTQLSNVNPIWIIPSKTVRVNVSASAFAMLCELIYVFIVTRSLATSSGVYTLGIPIILLWRDVLVLWISTTPIWICSQLHTTTVPAPGKILNNYIRRFMTVIKNPASIILVLIYTIFINWWKCICYKLFLKTLHLKKNIYIEMSI